MTENEVYILFAGISIGIFVAVPIYYIFNRKNKG